MASEVDICNLALARLGDNATVANIDPPEGSPQAEHCARFYVVARDALQERHPWGFATRRAPLARLAVTSRPWDFAYARPTDALRLLSVLPPDASTDDIAQPFDTESGDDGAALVLTDQADAHARFVARVTDTTKFPPLFVDALAWLLASYLAGPVLKGEVGTGMARSCLQSFLLTVASATNADSNQRMVRPGGVPEWISTR